MSVMKTVYIIILLRLYKQIRMIKLNIVDQRKQYWHYTKVW